MLAAILGGGDASAELVLNITHIGFPSLSGHVIRRGTWTPVIVDASLVNESRFDGYLRIAQFDTDGDAGFDTVELHLGEAPANSKRLFLYMLANPERARGDYYVEAFDSEGRAVKVISQGEPTYQARPPEGGAPRDIGHDDTLILSLSSSALGRVRDLVGQGRRDTYLRPPRIAHIGPDEVPELWIGLEAVDHLIWDDARPEELSQRQRQAIIDWVRHGGHLVIAASRSAGSIKLIESIREILPVELGEIVTAENLPDVRRELFAPVSSETDDVPTRRGAAPWWDVPFVNPIPVVSTTLRGTGYRVPTKPGYESNIMTRRTLGRGRVTFCAATLADLLKSEGSAIGLFERLLGLRTVDPDVGTIGTPVSLFPYFANAVAFVRSGSTYLVLFGVASVLYVLAATLGTWYILGIRKWRHHSWSAFAAVGVAAILLSAGAVNAMRGFGETLHQVSVVDGRADDPSGVATILFGVKSGMDKVLDFWLPEDRLSAVEPTATDCFLRPLPVGDSFSDAPPSFADPVDYRLIPSSAVMEKVRLRGTLKRLEGQWSGGLGGTVSGKIVVLDREIQDGSYLINRLGVELTDCYLFHSRVDAERVTDYRDAFIYALPLGTLPADGSRIDVRSRCYRTRPDETIRQYLAQCTLKRSQDGWASAFRTALINPGAGRRRGGGEILGQEKNAVLLLSTSAEYRPTVISSFGVFRGEHQCWSRDRARTLDLTHRLRRDNMVLVGFAEGDPGPARLFRRSGSGSYAMLEPDPESSWTMYRMDIPVTILDADVDNVLDNKEVKE